MDSTEFISFIDKAIHDEMLLGPARNEIRLTGLRNIKSDFNYIFSLHPNESAIDILKQILKERVENLTIYLDRKDLWLQEKTEKDILEKYLPKEPTKDEVLSFLNTLPNIPKQKSSFKKFQDKCLEKFGQKVDSQIILDFITN